MWFGQSNDMHTFIDALKKCFQTSTFYRFEGIKKEHIKALENKDGYVIGQHTYVGTIRTNSFDLKQKRVMGILGKPSPYISGYFTLEGQKTFLDLEVKKPRRQIFAHFASIIFVLCGLLIFALNFTSMNMLGKIGMTLGTIVFTFLFNGIIYYLYASECSSITNDFRELAGKIGKGK